MPKEEETRRQLEDLFERRLRELEELHRHIENLRQDNQQLSDTLNGILHGRTWRLRTRLVKLPWRG